MSADMKLAYTLAEAAEAAGVSDRLLRNARDRGDLTVHYAGSKPLIRRDDLDAWIESLPTERGAR